MKPVFYLLSILLFTILSCQKEEATKATELRELFHKEKQLNCLLGAMKDSITTEWDTINRLLEREMPPDMPADEKNNMLRVRNANLIRMFESFDEMEEEVKIALKKTEQFDVEMSRRITALKKDLHDIESRKMSLFQQIKQEEGTEKVNQLKSINQSLQAETCY